MIWLFILPLPVACIAWTVTHEEIFREVREYFARCANGSRSIIVRKLCYVMTCEYCFSHYVTILAVVFTGYHLLFYDWRGYIIAGFSVVWIANVYMTIFALLRQNLKLEQNQAKIAESEANRAKTTQDGTPIGVVDQQSNTSIS